MKNFQILAKQRFKNWWRKVKPKKKRYQFALVVVAILLFFGLFFWLPTVWRSDEVPESALADTYESILSGGTVTQMIRFAGETKDDPAAPLPMRIEKLQQKYALGEQIIKQASSQDQKDLGAKVLIESALDTERLYNKLGQSDSATIHLLRVISSDFMDEQNDDVQAIASVANVYALGLKHAEDLRKKRSDSETSKTEFRTAFAEVTKQFPENRRVARETYQIAKDLEESIGEELASQLMQTLADSYVDSTDSFLLDISKSAANEIKKTEFGLTVDDKRVQTVQQKIEAKQTLKARALIKALRSIDSESQADEIRAKRMFVDLAQSIVWMVQSGNTEVAAALIGESEELFNSSRAPDPIVAVFRSTSVLVEKIGKQMELPLALASIPQGRPAVIIWGDPASEIKTRNYTEQIDQVCAKFVEAGKLDCALIVLTQDSGSADQPDSDFSQFNRIQVVETNPSVSQRLQENFPVKWLPTCAIIDSSGNLIHLSPPPDILKLRLLELTH